MPKPGPAPQIAVAAIHRLPQHLSRRFQQVCDSLQNEVFAPHGIAAWQFALLVQVYEAPGTDRTRLAAAIGRDTSSAGQALEVFLARGWVEKQVSPEDRRATTYRVTPTGAAFRESLRPAVAGVAARLLAPLSAAEASNFLTLLARLVEAHEAHARPGAGRRPPRRRQPAGAAPPEGGTP